MTRTLYMISEKFLPRRTPTGESFRWALEIKWVDNINHKRTAIA